MRSEIVDIIWKLVIVFFIVQYVWRLLKEITGMVNYLRAGTYSGCILKSLGTVEQAALISGRSRYYHTFENYLVEYNYNGKLLQENVVSSKKGLKSGDYFAVHALDKNGVPVIQTDTCGAKIRFITLILLFSVVVTAAIVAFLSMRY